jgi:hypothetical protein
MRSLSSKAVTGFRSPSFVVTRANGRSQHNDDCPSENRNLRHATLVDIHDDPRMPQVLSIDKKMSIRCRDIDAHFSQSVFEGLRFAQSLNTLTDLEEKLLTRLGFADQKLSSAHIVGRKPATALRVQKQLRDFCCRLVRRSLGVQFGVSRDAAILVRFQQVLSGDKIILHEVVKQVETLLNSDEYFVTSLNTTFGEPLPPVTRRAILKTQKQRVRPQLSLHEGRPEPDICFLAVGTGQTKQSVPLTYELFKSVSELGQGMLVATLPRTVVALLDATRARLAGQIVRDEELLDGSEFKLGIRELWSSHHQRIASAIFSNELDIEIDPTGRLIVIDATHTSRPSDLDGDGFSETIVVSPHDASAVLSCHHVHESSRLISCAAQPPTN